MIDAYWSGYDDYKIGRHWFDNPYNYDTHLSQHLLWDDGYWSAHQDEQESLRKQFRRARELKEQENP